MKAKYFHNASHVVSMICGHITNHQTKFSNWVVFLKKNNKQTTIYYFSWFSGLNGGFSADFMQPQSPNGSDGKSGIAPQWPTSFSLHGFSFCSFSQHAGLRLWEEITYNAIWGHDLKWLHSLSFGQSLSQGQPRSKRCKSRLDILMRKMAKLYCKEVYTVRMEEYGHIL